MDILEIDDGDDCDNGDDGDDDDDGDDSDDKDDGGDGICPIFPIRLQRLPDHRADGTTSLMIKHPLVQMLGVMLNDENVVEEDDEDDDERGRALADAYDSVMMTLIRANS